MSRGWEQEGAFAPPPLEICCSLEYTCMETIVTKRLLRSQKVPEIVSEVVNLIFLGEHAPRPPSLDVLCIHCDSRVSLRFLSTCPPKHLGTIYLPPAPLSENLEK